MTGDNWERLKNLFEQALAIQLPGERSEFVAANCGGDAALRSELESLLAEHERMSTGFLEQPPVAEVRAPSHSPREGSQVGAYRLVRKLGQGGMGTVFLAERADGAYQKQVAIKLLSTAVASEELVRRFLEERQILARLEHPNIARLLDGGTTEQGQPYLVMDYVDGIPVDRYCRERSLDLDQRLELFDRVGAAVAYAHEHLVVHRDIKPGNILVTEDGTPKLLDFGIAKLLRPDTGRSEPGRTLILGTPEYSSPEQVRGQTITKATDVYSLGVLLYELLTDRSPYELLSRAAHEMARVICEEDPEPPSRAISHTPSRQVTAPEREQPSEDDRRRRKRLSGDLDNIVMMALRKDPLQRYQTVGELTEDLRRHARGQAVRAHSHTLGYRLLKFARRRRLELSVAALAAVCLVIAVEALRRSWIVPRAEVANRRVWTGIASGAAPDGRMLSFTDWHAGNLAVHDLETGQERRLTRNTGTAWPAFQSTISSIFSRDGRWIAYTSQPPGEQAPPMELDVVGRDGSGQRTVFRDSAQSWLIAHSWIDDRQVLVSSDQAASKTLLLVSIADGSSRVIPISPRWGGQIMASPDGKYVAYTAGQEGGAQTEVRVISLATGADSPLLVQPADDSVLGWSPDGDRLVFRSNRSGLGGYDIWWVSTANGRAVGDPERFGPSPDLVRSLGITKQGALYYVASNDSDEVFLADLDTASGRLSTPKVLSSRFAGIKSAPGWSPDGSMAFYLAKDMLHFYNVSTGSERDIQPKVADLKRVLQWHPDGLSAFVQVNSSRGQSGLSLVDTRTGNARNIFEGRMADSALSADGRTLYVQGGPELKSIVARNLPTGIERVLYTWPRPQDLNILRLRLSPDGKMLALQLRERPGFNALAVMPVAGGAPRLLLQVRRPAMFAAQAIAWSPDMHYIYAARCSGTSASGAGMNDRSEILRIPLDGGPAEATGTTIEGIVRHLHLSPDGRHVVFERYRNAGETWVLENFLPRN